RYTEHRQPGALEVLDAAGPLSQPARDAPTEEDDVLGLAPGDGLGAPPLALGGLGLLAGLELRAGLAVGLPGPLAGPRGPVPDRGPRRADAVHLGADGVDLRELFGRDESLGDHRAVDELRARIVRGRDHVAPAEPGIAQQVPALRRFLDLDASDREVIGRI